MNNIQYFMLFSLQNGIKLSVTRCVLMLNFFYFYFFLDILFGSYSDLCLVFYFFKRSKKICPNNSQIQCLWVCSRWSFYCSLTHNSLLLWALGHLLWAAPFSGRVSGSLWCPGRRWFLWRGCYYASAGCPGQHQLEAPWNGSGLLSNAGDVTSASGPLGQFVVAGHCLALVRPAPKGSLQSARDGQWCAFTSGTFLPRGIALHRAQTYWGEVRKKMVSY